MNIGVLATSWAVAAGVAGCADSHSTYALTEAASDGGSSSSVGAARGVDASTTDTSKAADSGARSDGGSPSGMGESEFSIGGIVTGLAGSGLVLENNGADDLAISSGGAFTFPAPVFPGAAYAVTVKAGPTSPWQTCLMSPGSASGVVADSDVTSVGVACTTDTHDLSGAVTGLVGNGVVTVRNGNDAPLLVKGNAGFSVAMGVPSGTAYDLKIAAQPDSEPSTCSVTGSSGAASGMVQDAEVTFAVTCASAAQEFVDNGTQRNGMHSCPYGFAMTGYEDGNNQLLCSNHQTIDSSRETVDTGTQRAGMHACPIGSVMTGIHVAYNYLACTPLVAPPDPTYGEGTDSGTQRAGMHACPVLDTAMSGVNVGSNIFLCGGYE